MTDDEWKSIAPLLQYNKGEHRFKHVGSAASPQMIEKDGGWIGECPKGFNLTVALTLVREGIPEFRTTVAERPYRIWNYYDGAIYASRSEDGGTTWHGYPNGLPAKPPPREILRELESRANQRGEGNQLKKWLQKQWNK